MSSPPCSQVRDSLDLDRRFVAYKRAAAERWSVPRPRITCTLWQDDSASHPHQRATPSGGRAQCLPSTSPAPPPKDVDGLIKQPETKPISQEQLVAEVKGIYAGLVMVERKCIEVDNAQGSNASAHSPTKLNNEQWQALIALHRTLLHEHHDFFLASQHPSASQALRRLASKYAMPARMWRHGIHSFLELFHHPLPAVREPKYAMPARMWRHGIHSFLELLRHRLPAAREHMLTFMYLAYSMMALLYETVPDFEDTWIECLGGLGRYRMAIEDDNMSDREVWTSVTRHWYNKASEKDPTTGHLYHHLAILARSNALQQLHYYTKSLCVVNPFLSARESILTLFDPLLRDPAHQIPRADNGQWQTPVALHQLSDPASLRSARGASTRIRDRLRDLADEYDTAFFEWCVVKPRSLPEDHAIRGPLWTEKDFLINRFVNNDDDDDDCPSSTTMRILTLITINLTASVSIVWLCDGVLAQVHNNYFSVERVATIVTVVAILVAVLARSHNDWQKGRQFIDLPRTPAEDVVTHHPDLHDHNSVSRQAHLLKSQQGKIWTYRKLLLSFFLATHGVPILAVAFTLHPGFRIASGVTASVSGVTVIPLRTSGGFPIWSWILAYGVWVGAFSAYLCLQTLRLPSEPNRRRPLYLFLVIMGGLHMTIAISQGSDSIPEALTMYGPILLTASAFLMALLLRAIHPGAPNGAPPDDLAASLGGATLGFGP